MVVTFWVCVALIVYPYAIYPLVLVLLNRLFGRKTHAAELGYEPTITVILPVHNEAGRIPAKVRNLLALDYPPDKLQMLVIGDGCTDDSLERAARGGRGASDDRAAPAARRQGCGAQRGACASRRARSWCSPTPASSSIAIRSSSS